MSDFLDRMASSSQLRLEQAQADRSLAEVRSLALAREPRPLPRASFHLFAEIKPVSPAEGSLGSSDPAETAGAYCEGGATAISVLTEPTEFGGSLELLRRISAVSTVPVMCKDFIIDPHQVWEAREAGADGVLAIARMFDRTALQEIVDSAREAELFVLLEVFDETDIELVAELDLFAPRPMVGVNSRDLSNLAVRPGLHAELIDKLPKELVAIAESGIHTPDQVGELAAMGYNGVLVGTSLMRSARPADMVTQMHRAATGASL